MIIKSVEVVKLILNKIAVLGLIPKYDTLMSIKHSFLSSNINKLSLNEVICMIDTIKNCINRMPMIIIVYLITSPVLKKKTEDQNRNE